jgi:hypothetical protein
MWTETGRMTGTYLYSDLEQEPKEATEFFSLFPLFPPVGFLPYPPKILLPYRYEPAKR